jgi:hypothetical protein
VESPLGDCAGPRASEFVPSRLPPCQDGTQFRSGLLGLLEARHGPCCFEITAAGAGTHRSCRRLPLALVRWTVEEGAHEGKAFGGPKTTDGGRPERPPRPCPHDPAGPAIASSKSVRCALRPSRGHAIEACLCPKWEAAAPWRRHYDKFIVAARTEPQALEELQDPVERDRPVPPGRAVQQGRCVLCAGQARPEPL